MGDIRVLRVPSPPPKRRSGTTGDMPEEDNRRLTPSEALEIGMAAKDPLGYMVVSLLIEIIKLPFRLAVSLISALRPPPASARPANHTPPALPEIEKRRREEKARRMESAKQRYIQKVEEARKKDMLDGMRSGKPRAEVRAEPGPVVHKLVAGEATPGLCVDEYLCALELIGAEEVRAFVSDRGICPNTLAGRLRELQRRNPPFPAASAWKLAPRVRSALSLAGKLAAERFRHTHPGREGTAEISAIDLFEASIRTEGFVPELKPVWDHLRAPRNP